VDRIGKVKPLRGKARKARMSKETRAKRKDVKTRKLEEMARRRKYRFMAVSSTFLMFGLASGATWFRFFITDYSDSGVSLADFYGTLFCAAGATLGMEFYARYAHRILWHDWQPGWSLHESHHVPRTGPFEANDIYAVANAVPALSLCIYGFLHSGLGPAMCWGTGLGITLYGWMYMFVHDGLVHKRFPVGPIGELPSLKRIAIAHTIHHSEKFGGVPYGLFLAEDELSQVEGGVQELDLLVERANAKEQAEKEKALESLDA
jgi:beta-carotene 3-hydroxylase